MLHPEITRPNPAQAKSFYTHSVRPNMPRVVWVEDNTSSGINKILDAKSRENLATSNAQFGFLLSL